MTTEFVVIDPDGVECDWIDPVLNIDEQEDAWNVDNGYGIYIVPNVAGYTYLQREKQVQS